MVNEVSDAVPVAATGLSPDELGKHLQRIIDDLRAHPGGDTCLSDRCPEDIVRWPISTPGSSQFARLSEGECAQVHGMVGLIDTQLANAVDFNSFPIV